jgi:hypothetical protein
MLPEIYAREILRGLRSERSRQAPCTRFITRSPVTAKGLLRASGSALIRFGQRLEAWASHPILIAAPPASAHVASGYATRADSSASHGNGQCHE